MPRINQLEHFQFSVELLENIYSVFSGNMQHRSSHLGCSVKIGAFRHGTHLTFNAIRVLMKNFLTFCLCKVSIKCRVSIRKSSMQTLPCSRRNIMEKKVSTLPHFLKKYFLFILNIIEIQ